LRFAGRSFCQIPRKPPFGPGTEPAQSGDSGLIPLAFTVAPHLQIINHRGRFSRFVGI
jgi:hypothetical protein